MLSALGVIRCLVSQSHILQGRKSDGVVATTKPTPTPGNNRAFHHIGQFHRFTQIFSRRGREGTLSRISCRPLGVDQLGWGRSVCGSFSGGYGIYAHFSQSKSSRLLVKKKGRRRRRVILPGPAEVAIPFPIYLCSPTSLSVADNRFELVPNTERHHGRIRDSC